MLPTLKAAYIERATRGDFELDAAQQALCARYDDLLSAIKTWGEYRPSWADWLLRRRAPAVPCGLYVHGKVGRGKTMLMNLFFEHVTHISKRRIHFHDFMREIHEEMKTHRAARDEDPIGPIARKIAQRNRLLCFDEFHVSDIADAMILSRLFTALFEEGVILVATSNSALGELYHNGLNRHYFLPFIDVLKQNCAVWNLDARTDFRRENKEFSALQTPLNEKTHAAMDQAFVLCLKGAAVASQTLNVSGHDVFIPQAGGDVARFHFDDLCARPYGAADYIAIAQKFKTVFIDNVPLLTPDKANQAKRFTVLIDVLYEHQTRLFMSSQVPFDQMYRVNANIGEFARTVSRLYEMTRKPPA